MCITVVVVVDILRIVGRFKWEQVANYEPYRRRGIEVVGLNDDRNVSADVMVSTQKWSLGDGLVEQEDEKDDCVNHLGADEDANNTECFLVLCGSSLVYLRLTRLQPRQRDRMQD